MRLLSNFNIKEILKFLVGGGTAVLVDSISYFIIIQLGVQIWIAKTISYILGAAVGFVINKLWTFESKKFSTTEIIKYIVLYACSACANALVNSIVCCFCDNKVFAFLCATAVSTILNFLGQKFLVFAKKKQ